MTTSTSSVLRRSKPDRVTQSYNNAPCGDDSTSLIERLKAVLPEALFLKDRVNRSANPVFLRSGRCHGLLHHPLFVNDPTINPRAEVVTKLQVTRCTMQSAESDEPGLRQHWFRCFGFGRQRLPPAAHLTGAAVAPSWSGERRRPFVAPVDH